MAELDKPGDEPNFDYRKINRLTIKNRSQNNKFFFNLQQNNQPLVQWFHIIIIPVNILFIVNDIKFFTDGIRVFLNTLTEKIEANCKITIFFVVE